MNGISVWGIRILCVFALVFASAFAGAQGVRLSGCESQSLCVISAYTGQVVASHNPDALLAPASLTKLVTTAAAISALGANTSFCTDFYFSSKTGTLIVRGGADPTVNSKFFAWNSTRAMAEALVKYLPQNAELRMVLDCSYLQGPPVPSKRLWEDMGNYFGVPPGSFNFGDNTQTITLRAPETAGQLCEVAACEPPDASDALIRCYATAYTGKSDSAYVYAPPPVVASQTGPLAGCVYLRYVSGSIPAGAKAFKVRAAHPNPTAAFANSLVAELRKLGVSVGKVEYSRERPSTETAKLVYTHRSPSVLAIAKCTNHHSVNLFADALMLRLCGAGQASFDAALRSLNGFAAKHADPSVSLWDGCGLSPANRVTARSMARLLMAMKDNAHFRGTLPTVGREGTVAGWGRGTRLEGKATAKSGTMDGVVAYAGYCETKSGDLCVFCAIINAATETNAKVKRTIAMWLDETIANL